MDAVSAEFRAYVERARTVPGLLAHALRTWSVGQLRAELGCDEAAALRVLACGTPRAHHWHEDVALVTAFAGVDRRRLARLLRAARAAFPEARRAAG